MDESAEQLSQQAAALDIQAVRAGEETAKGRTLRAQAADLRVRAIGTRIYPVLVCASCFSITGWRGPADHCDSCLRREQLRAAYTNPHGGWVDVRDIREAPPARPALPLRKRFASLLGRGEDAGRSADHEWLTLVDPDESGPISPETGYQIEVARRDQLPAVDGSGTIVIRFSTTTSRFTGTTWERLETTRIRHSEILVPSEVPAGLPIEQITEAWGDYGNAVHIFNREGWRREAQAREAQRQAVQAQQEALDQQAHIAELLREEG